MVYRTPKDVQERKDAKRRHILDVASKVFADRGYHGTTVKDVVEEAGISVGSFYFYFSNKEDLFEKLFDEMNETFINVITDAVETMPDNAVESICKAVTLALLSFQNEKEFAKIMLIESVGLNPRFEAKRIANNKRFSNILEDVLKELQKKKLVDIPCISVASISFMGSMYTVIIDWLQESSSALLTDYAYPLIVYNLQALRMKFEPDVVESIIESILSEGSKQIEGEDQDV